MELRDRVHDEPGCTTDGAAATRPSVGERPRRRVIRYTTRGISDEMATWTSTTANWLPRVSA